MGMSQNNNFRVKIGYYGNQNPEDQGCTNFPNCKVKAKFTLEQATKAQRGGGCLELQLYTFLNPYPANVHNMVSSYQC